MAPICVKSHLAPFLPGHIFSGSEFGAARVIMKRASVGTGVIAGGPVRAIFEAAGVQDILTKCIGTNNPHNVFRAAIDGIMQMSDPHVRRQELQNKEWFIEKIEELEASKK